jgi:uncharacterized protein (DUF983 family)
MSTKQSVTFTRSKNLKEYIMSVILGLFCIPLCLIFLVVSVIMFAVMAVVLPIMGILGLVSLKEKKEN